MSDRGLYDWILVPPAPRPAPVRPPGTKRLDGVMAANGCLAGNHELDGNRCRWCHTPMKEKRQ